MRLKKGFESICKPLQCRCNILSTNNKVAKLGKIEQKFTDNRTNLHPKTPPSTLLNILLHFLISLGHTKLMINIHKISSTLERNANCKPRTTDAQWSLFSSKYQTFGLGQKIWADKFWDIWGTFGWFISNHFGTVSPCFPLINHYLYKKLRLFIQIPKFGIRHLAIVSP